MGDVWTEIERAVGAGDADAVVDACLVLDEPAREGLAPRAAALVGEVDRAWESPVRRAAQTALLALGPPPAERSDVRHPAYDRLVEIVRSRPRPWRDAWAQGIVHGGYGYTETPATWRALRTLVAAGDCARPTGEGYTWMFVHAMQCLADGVWCEAGSVAEALRQDPALLGDELWQAFRLACATGRLDHALGTGVVELAADGSIPRERLVDETLDALRSASDAGVLRHIARFHDRDLKPTVVELAGREATYRAWLESDRDAMVGFALGNLGRLSKRVPLDARELLDRIEPLVALKAKAHAAHAVRLAGDVADREPAMRRQALSVAADGLAHAAPEVQRAALDVLERHPDAIERDRVAPGVDLVDPALRPRVERLVGATTDTPDEPDAVPVPAASVVDPDRVPRLLPDQALAPVADLKELLDLAGRLLEGLDDPDEAERLVDGISRLCDVEVPAGRRAALLKRTRRRSGPVATLVRAWLGWDEPHPPWTGASRALGPRLDAVAVRVAAGRADVLLSAPTHRGGFVDPEMLAARVERATMIEDQDLAQALLRFPEMRPEHGLRRLASLEHEVGSIARALVTGEREPGGEATLPAAWDAVAVLADPAAVVVVADPPQEPFDGHSSRPESALSPARALAGYASLLTFEAADGRLRQRWLSTVWPARKEIYYATVIRTLRTWWLSVLNTQQREDRFEAAYVVMSQPDEPLGPYALELIAMGLLETNEVRHLAAEVVAAAIETRRLVPDRLGRAIAAECVRPDVVPNRFGGALADVAAIGPLHAHEVQQVVEATLGELGAARPPIVSALDLLRLLAQQGDAAVSDPAARAWLDGLGGSSKSSRLARAALAVTGTGAARSRAARDAAEEAERERAARWRISA